MKASVLLNAAAGRPGQLQTGASRLRELFAQAGVRADVWDVQGPDLLSAARAAASSDADVVVMGGATAP